MDKRSRKATGSAQPVPKPRPTPTTRLPAGYAALLEDIKTRIRAAQVKAALSVNRELIQLYWGIGRDIVRRQREEGWGKAVVEQLATDLQREFPAVGGFSAGNIWRMRAFFLAYASGKPELAQPVREVGAKAILAQPARELADAILQQPVSEIALGCTAQSPVRKDVEVPAQHSLSGPPAGPPRTRKESALLFSPPAPPTIPPASDFRLVAGATCRAPPRGPWNLLRGPPGSHPRRGHHGYVWEKADGTSGTWHPEPLI